MQKCLDLAVIGFGNVSPNPMVGCVILHKGEIVSEGYHQKYGEAHAEVNAIKSIRNNEIIKECVLFVNLEPCVHHGKTPPCVDLIVNSGIKHIVIGMKDPNPLVSGKGIDKLIQAGCKVEVGVLDAQCRKLNRRFYTFYEEERPYIILKWAQTKDGYLSSTHRLNTSKFEEKVKNYRTDHISNESSRKLVHRWRSEEMGIMVGTNTVLLDNPRLTVRDCIGKNPTRVIIDRWLRVPRHYHIYDQSAPTIVFNERETKEEDNISKVLIRFDVNIVEQMMQYLFSKNIQSLMIEGGELLFNTFIGCNIWDEARVLISNKEFGKGVKAPDILRKNVSYQQNIEGDKLIIFENI